MNQEKENETKSVYGEGFNPIEKFSREFQKNIRKYYDEKCDFLKVVGYRHGKMGYAWVLLARKTAPEYCVYMEGGQAAKNFEEHTEEEITFHTLEEIIAENYLTF